MSDKSLHSTMSDEGLREVYTVEFKPGDSPMRFKMKVPWTAVSGQLILNLGGQRDMSLFIPRDVEPGDTIIVVAPRRKRKSSDTESATSTALSSPRTL